MDRVLDHLCDPKSSRSTRNQDKSLIFGQSIENNTLFLIKIIFVIVYHHEQSLDVSKYLIWNETADPQISKTHSLLINKLNIIWWGCFVIANQHLLVQREIFMQTLHMIFFFAKELVFLQITNKVVRVPFLI